jgi:hypothetical protein
MLIDKSNLFRDSPMLGGSPCTLKSPVSLEDFRAVVAAVAGTAVTIKNNNFRGLSQLCAEFGFGDLAAQLSQFRDSGDLKEEGTREDSEARKRLSALEERMQQRNKEIAALRCELSRQLHVYGSAVEALFGRVGRLEAEVIALRSTTEIETAPTLTQQELDLRKLKDTTESLAARPPPSAPSAPPSPVPAPTLPAILVAPALPSPSGWDSVIVSGFPEIFAEFKEKKFTLLWRGSRDGFGAGEFHKRCDGHTNTLTVILDRRGNIFGGFTPVKWEPSKKEKYKADPSLKSFIFTLKNPHNVPPRIFMLKAEKKDSAIICHSELGPDFRDITVSDSCDQNLRSFTSRGINYTADTGLGVFFTHSQYFRVKEIEVFEITT